MTVSCIGVLVEIARVASGFWSRLVPTCMLTLSFFLSALPISANAAVFSARISNILFYEQGDLVYVYVHGGTQGRPSCAGSNGDYLSFSMSRPRAKEYLAGLMMAFSTGKTVTFYNYDGCIDQSVSATIMYFTVND